MKSGRFAIITLAGMLICGAAFGQELEFLFGQGGPSVPGTDLSGWWTPSRDQDAGLGTAAGALVDYGGLPLNNGGRLFAMAWDASRMTVRQQQCAGYVPPYWYVAPGNYRIWEERDPTTQRLIAVRMYAQISEGNRTIWMDGRPHPPAYAAHTFTGFSTGKFEGNALTVLTTHLKRGWIRANGVAQSDEATLLEHFVRHGDRVTYFSVINDPVTLAEPLSKTSTLVRYLRDPNAWLYACDDGEQILDKSEDRVPSYLFGKNPYVREYAEKYKIPLFAAMGGAETMHPEFLAKLKDPAAMEKAAVAQMFPSGPQRKSVATDPDPHDGEIHAWPVQGNIFMLVGDGGNIAVQVGKQGAFVVDTGSGNLSDKVIEAIRKLAPNKPIQFIVNTSFLPDHTGGNGKIRIVGEDPSLPGSFFSGNNREIGQGATVIGHQNVQNRMSAPTGKVAPTPPELWPTDTFLEDRRRKYYNGEAVEVFWKPNAITDGDSIVQFRRSDVIVTGEIFSTTQYPRIDIKSGGSIQGEIKALNDILNETVYEHDEEGGTMIVPGHGRVCDEYDVSEYRDMLVIIRDRVQAMIKSGATLPQVLAARLTDDFDDRYGATTGPWTTNMFVEAVYTSLKEGPVRSASN